MKTAGSWLGVLIFCAATGAEAAPSVALVQETAGPDGNALVTGLRLGFAKTGADWTALCADTCRFDAKTPTQWTVRYRGDVVGSVTTKDWLDADMIAMTGMLRITSSAPPREGARTKIFAGWSDRAVHRPLAATSIAVAAPSSRWNPADAETGDAARMLPMLAARMPKIPHCVGGEPQGDGRALAEDDIRIADVWQSESGARLLSASVKPERVRACDYTADTLADVWAYDDGKSLHALPAL